MIRVVLILVAALIAAPAATGATLSPADDQWGALTQIASRTAGEPVSVSCSNETSWEAGLFTGGYNDLPSSRIWGYTYPDEKTVTISRVACAGLLTLWAHPRMDETYTIMGNPGYNRGIEGMAVHAFAHELGHIKYGYLSTSAETERAAECYATSHDTQVARTFGATPRWADWMHQSGEAYHRLLPAIYQQGNCP